MTDETNLTAGDVVKVYFGGATDTGTGEATMIVQSVGETVTGSGVDFVRQRGLKKKLVQLNSTKWRIDSDSIHAIHWYGKKPNCEVVE